MKVAVSLADDVFERADRLAEHLGISRSQLYGQALIEYVDRHASDDVTEALDSLCDELSTGSDALVRRSGRRTLQRSEW